MQEEVVKAQAAARAQSLQHQSLTPDLVRLEAVKNQRAAIEKWDGHLPTVAGASGNIIDLGSLKGTAPSGTPSAEK